MYENLLSIPVNVPVPKQTSILVHNICVLLVRKYVNYRTLFSWQLFNFIYKQQYTLFKGINLISCGGLASYRNGPLIESKS
jgi:hypothetical protein